MTPYLDEVLRNLVRSVCIRPPEVITAENRSLHTPEYEDFRYAESLELTKGLDEKQVISRIRAFFYQHFYQTGSSKNAARVASGVMPALPGESSASEAGKQTAFGRLLTDADWHRVGLPETYRERVLLQKGVMRFEPGNGRYRWNESNYNAELQFPEKRTEGEWGFVTSRMPFVSVAQIIRFYFNLKLDGAARCAEHIAEKLTAYGLPFEIKYLTTGESNSPSRDTGVLYASAEHFVPISFALNELYPALKAHLRPGVPLFVREFLLPDNTSSGIGFAEDPLPDETWGQMSFGQSRCHLLATFLVEIWLEGYHKPDGAVNPDRVVDRIEAIYPGLKNFFLNPRSPYQPYPFSLLRLCGVTTRPVKKWPRWFPFFLLPLHRAPIADAHPLLQEAVYVGFLFCREALWLSPEVCTWVGLDTRQSRFMNGLTGDHRRLGRPAVAAFLYALFEAVGNPLFNYTAKAACRGVLGELPPVAPVAESAQVIWSLDNRIGLYGALENAYWREAFKPTRKGRFKKLQACFEMVSYHDLHVDDWATVNQKITQQPVEAKWYEFLPGLDGLALLGFSYLHAYEPRLVPAWVPSLIRGESIE